MSAYGRDFEKTKYMPFSIKDKRKILGHLGQS